MAKKNLYTGDLLKSDNWGEPMVKDGVRYDAAAGSAVQNYIQESLNGKWGCVYDNNAGKYYIFADEESRDIYLQHEADETLTPEIEALKLAEMNSFSNYTIKITLDSEQTKPVNAILIGQTGNKVVFVANTYDNDGNELDEAITVNYTITRPDGSKSFVTHFVATKQVEEAVVDNYLVEGQNTVAINIVGSQSNAIANATVVFQVINLNVEDSYDISKVHDVSGGKNQSLSVTFSVSGSSVSNKFIEWYIDGVKQDDLIGAMSGAQSGRVTTSFPITAELFSEGRHNIQYRAWITVNDQKFYTRTYYKDFIVYNGGNKPIIAVSYSLPIGQEPFVGNEYLHPIIYEAVQYTSFVLPIAVFKNNTLNVSTTVEVKYEDGGVMKTDVQYSNLVEENKVWDANITPSITGPATIVITAGDHDDTVYEIGADIDENNLNIHEITAGLRLDLRAAGKSNSAPDRDVWEYVDGNKTYSTTFNGVTFDETSGWNDNSLVLSNGDSIEINYKPLTPEVATNGLTFEIEFSTFNVSDDDTVILNMKDDNGNAGLLITASEAIFSDSLSDTVSTKFKSNENYRLAFVVAPTNIYGKPIILIYVNGAICGGIGFPSIAKFIVDKNINISSSPSAGVKVKHIRIYNEALTSEDILNNYMLYRDTFREMEDIYTRNDLYVSTGVFDLNKIANILPIMLITDSDIDPERNNIENMMSFTSVDKKTPILLKQVLYINNLDPTTSFCCEYPQMTCQGTSSMNYPIKNLRLYLKDKAKGKYGTWPLSELYMGDPKDPEKMVSLSNPHGSGSMKGKKGKGKVAFKSGLAGTFSEGERIPQEVNCWTFKADYAESSSSHNTGAARIWNQVMRDAILGNKYVSRTRAQAAVMNTNDKRDVRTAVDGFPCVVFYRYSEDDLNWKFLGKFNFNNDKSTESVFGFCEIPGILYTEYKYEEITEEDYNQAYAANPNDCKYSTKSFDTTESYEKTVRAFVGKNPAEGEEPEPLTEADFDTYVLSLIATPYEYSKPYQKSDVYVNGVLDRDFYRHKYLVSGDTSNKIYCIEVLENEAAITNFTADVSEFDRDWAHGFEFRYPEIEGNDENPDAECNGGLTNLREFYAWCHSTMYNMDTFNANPTVVIDGDLMENSDLVYKQEERTYMADGTYEASTYEEYVELMKKKFEKEKWDHFDVFKVAAYYIYLMRFGAVDQVCKNSMFTTEGTYSYIQKTTTTSEEGGTKTVSVNFDDTLYGRYCKWFFINYDNDTILGLNNDGKMVYGPDIDRSTQVGDGYWVEHDHPTQEQIDGVIGTYNSIDDLKHDVDEGVITPAKGDKYLIGGSVWEWFNESSYAYAGHNSVLWNNLEADDEFMTIVRDMDDAIYRAGLTYNAVVKMFNDKQATMWCEKILNDDAKKKYIDQFTDYNNNHLSKMHGPRTSHRMWWLSKRFTYFDSKFVSGEYMSTKVLLKIQGENRNPVFTIMPTEFMNYGWGVSSRSLGQTGIASQKDDNGHFMPMAFDLRDGGLGSTGNFSVGDPVEIYASPYISELDLSEFAINLQFLSFENLQNEVLGSQLKRLILGKEGRTNSGKDGLEAINNLEKAEKLEYIDIRGFKEIKNLDLTENLNIKEVYAFNSGIQGIELPNGSRIERMYLPTCYNTMELHSVNYLTKDNIIFENDDMSNLTTIIIDNCNALNETSFDFIEEWYNQRNGAFGGCTLNMYNIDWKISYADLDILEELKVKCSSYIVRGRITITDRVEGRNREETLERVLRIKSLFGENCFNEAENPPIVVNCYVDFVIINATATEVTANKSTVIDFSCDIYPAMKQGESIFYQILSGPDYGSRTGVNISNNYTQHTARLTTEELVTNSNDTITVRVTYDYNYHGSNEFTSDINILIKDPTYPMNANHLTLSGPSSLKESNSYEYELGVFDPNGKAATGSYDVEWSFNKIASEYLDYENCTIVNGNKNRFRVVTSDQEPPTSFDVKLTAKVTCENGTVIYKSIDLLVLNKDVVLTVQSNPVVMNVLREAPWIQVSDSNVLMKSEAMAVTDFGDSFNGLVSDAFGFHELVEFENLQSIPDGAFAGCSITGLTIPESLVTLGDGVFENCNALSEIDIQGLTNLTEIPERTFYNCVNLKKLTLPETITKINAFAFGNTTNITRIVLSNPDGENGALVVPNTLAEIADGAFESYTVYNNAITINENNTITYIEIPDGLGRIEDGKFDGYLLRGSKMEQFKASLDNMFYSTPEGVLYNKTQQTMYKYPCNKTDKDMYSPTENCLVLYDYGFYNTKLRSVKTGALLRTVNNHEFDSSRYLTTVDMGDSVDVIELGSYCFYDCQGLTTVVYPPAVEVLGTCMYYRNNLMDEIVIPEGVKTVYEYLIRECNNITELICPDSVTALIRDPYSSNPNIRPLISNCDSLEYVKLPKYLVLESNVCNNNPSLTTVMLPAASYYDEDDNNVVNPTPFGLYFLIGSVLPSFVEFQFPEENNGLTYFVHEGVIYKNVEGGGLELSNVPVGLSNMTILDGTTSIIEQCFYRRNIQNLDIPDSVRTVGTMLAFQCSNLETVTIGANVAVLEDRAFQKCENLHTVVYKRKGTTKIRFQAFYECSNLSSITMCQLSVPAMDDMTDGNFLKGYNPFGQIDSYPGSERVFTRNERTFAGYLVYGDKKLKVPYFTDGVDSSIDLYRGNEFWSDPLLTPVDGGDTGFDSGCGFQIEYLTFSDDIYIKVLNSDGSDYDYAGTTTSQIPYLHKDDEAVMGVYQTSGEHAGYYKFSLSPDIISDKPMNITMGGSGDYVGTIRPSAYEEHKYTVQIGSLGSMGTRGLKSGNMVLSASEGTVEGDDTVSRYEYDMLVSRLNSLETKLKNVMGKA